MIGMRQRQATRLAVAGALMVASLFFHGRAHAQGFPDDVFAIDRFGNVNTPGETWDATVRITNPGTTGLRAWGTHVETNGATTETTFQRATLSTSELGVLTGKCGDIADNGSGFGVCKCGEEPGDGTSSGTDRS